MTFSASAGTDLIKNKKDEHQGTGTGDLLTYWTHRQITSAVLNKLEKFRPLTSGKTSAVYRVDHDVLHHAVPLLWQHSRYGSTRILGHGNTVDLHVRAQYG